MGYTPSMYVVVWLSPNFRCVPCCPYDGLPISNSGIARNAEAYAECLATVPGAVHVLLETTAGTGTALGSTFEELARLRDAIPPPYRRRVAYCADTCHLYASGYDLVGDFDGVWERWDAVLGLPRLKCLHLNDSKTPFNSHRDRHAWIGEGSLGPEPFRQIMQEPIFGAAIKVVETPKGDDPIRHDRRMLRRLRAYARNARRR